MDFTVPTTITEKQYADASFAIDPNTGDHFLMYGEKKTLWVGRDLNSARNSANFPKEEVEVVDDAGCRTWVECNVCPTGEALNDLDIDELAQGKIVWR